jgi:high-affinity nickel-transport protein
MPEDPFVTYSNATAVTVGMLHGVGAETPTQVVIFLTAAGVAGTGTGVLLLVVFLGGLLLSNTAIAAASTFGFLQAGRNFAVYATVSVVTGALSLALGGLFLFGQGSVLPAFFG